MSGPIYDPYPFPCCSHCGCRGDEAVGHDDTCSYGCNDDEMVSES